MRRRHGLHARAWTGQRGYRHNDDAFDRFICCESHDEVSSGKARVPHEINPADPTGWNAQKRSTLAAALVFTAPGIPMIFQGQEFRKGGWFRDTVLLDWDQRDEFHGIVRLYCDLIGLRLNRDGFTRGLCGQFTQRIHANEERKVIAFHRWDKGGPADDVVVVANFFRESQDGYIIGFPSAGPWKLRFNSDWQGYSDAFGGHASNDVAAQGLERRIALPRGAFGGSLQRDDLLAMNEEKLDALDASLRQPGAARARLPGCAQVDS